MARNYRTKEGDVLDWICWRAYGSLSPGLVERVVAVNANVADSAAMLPAGLLLVLPDDPAPMVERRVRLWG